MDRKWWVEHQIRELVDTRGMRLGKAIRRVLNTDDSDTQSLASIWADGEFSVTMGDSRELFVAAYDRVRSCMWGEGENCHQAYAPNGVAIAVVVLGGVIRARGLHREGRFCKTYGAMWHALDAYLRVVLGFERTGAWLDDVAHLCQVTETIQQTEEIPVYGPAHGPFASPLEARKHLPAGKNQHVWPEYNKSLTPRWYVCAVESYHNITYTHHVTTFTPYLDTH